MCLSDAFLVGAAGETLICRRVSQIRMDGSTILLTDVMGKRTGVEGVIDEVDLVDGLIRIRPPKASTAGV